MKLFQLLLLIKNNTRIILFDINGIEFFRCADKESIPIDLNEYDVLDITAGWRNVETKESCLFITLQK